jgi:cell division protein FtsI (penicillin-binding protein 3)
MNYFKHHIKAIKNEDIKRIQYLGWFFSFLILIVLFRTFTIQVWKREPFKNLGLNQYQRQVRLTAKRGLIYDRNMNIFAMDYPSSSLALDPFFIKDKQNVIKILREVLKGDVNDYQALFNKKENNHFIKIKSHITKKEENILAEMNIPGLIFYKERRRVRPYNIVGRQIIGITNAEHKGVCGVEQSYDTILRGVDGWAIYQKDGLNRKFSSLDYPIEESINGNNVVLTIDYVHQAVVEEELVKGLKFHQAKWGAAILMDPFTGEILAMASIAGKNCPGDSDFDKNMKNRAVQAIFEPGSTLKILTTAAAIEEGKFKPNSLIHCENGEFNISGHIIHDHDDKHDWLTLIQILEKSSNIGIAKVGLKLGKEKLFKYIQNFGFGNRTGIRLPGEEAGILQPVYHWTDFSTATIAFGQGISVTGLQMACMVSVIANGGELVKPCIIKGINDQDSRVKEKLTREVIRRVISEETSEKMRHILEMVVQKGNAGKAAVEGIRVAGKTGTAQKSVAGYKGYLPQAYISTFAGFWPVEEPRFVFVVILDEAKHLYWGAHSTAPIFAEVVKRIEGLPNIRLFPEEPSKKYKRNKTFLFSNLESGEAGSHQVKTTLTSKSNSSLTQIPQLMGLSLREALQKLAVRGVEARVQGSGIVQNQDPQPGAKVKEGLICKLICR